MKPETLEALLLDHAMGELSPEISELLEAHLAHRPEAARQAAALFGTVVEARRAVAVRAEAPQRPLAVGRLRQAQVVRRRQAFIWEGAKLAACVVLGLTLGWYGRAERPASAVAAAPAIMPARPAVSATVPRRSANATPDFWSLARLEAAQQERQPAESRVSSRFRLRWDSPVKMPHLEDNL
jgi:anti-sigma factor RsiW